MLNDEYRDSYEFIPFDEERVLSHIRRRNLKILAAIDSDRVIAFVATRLEERGEEDIYWLASELRNRKSTEDLLVTDIEKQAKGETVSTSLDEGNKKISEWIDRGYKVNPGWLRMSAKLDGLRQLPVFTGDIRIRGLRSDEEKQLIEVINAGFGWKRLEPGILETWRVEDPPFNEEWVQVAEIGQRIVSAVVVKPDTEYNKYLHIMRGYLGPAATLQEFRNKHLASALTASAMNFLLEKKFDSVRLGTSEQNVSSTNLLRNLGFRVDGVRKILRKSLKNLNPG